MTESGKPVPNEIIHAKDVTDELDKKVDTSSVLTLEEIKNSTDLSGKVASAEALETIMSQGGYHAEGETLNIAIKSPCLIVIKGDGNEYYYVGMISRPGYSNIVRILPETDSGYDSGLSYNKSTGTLSLPTYGWYEYAIIQ